MSEFDFRELRNAFSSFLTGVTVVTTREPDGTPRGFTANSFASVSLNPPLLLVCIGKAADSYPVFATAGGFAINILADNQVETSGLFASKRADKFEQCEWSGGPGGLPLLDGVCAWFECGLENLHDGGDHTILVGRVRAFDYNDVTGLGFVRGGYVNLGLEQAVVGAAASGSGTVVGAIVDHDRKVMLVADPESGRLQPPASGLDGSEGSVSKLNILLTQLGVNSSIASLYAVFENEQDGQQSIYYRAFAEPDSVGGRFYSEDNTPWDNLSSSAVETMLRRYFHEMKNQRFGIYFGSDRTGAVRIVEEE